MSDSWDDALNRAREQERQADAERAAVEANFARLNEERDADIAKANTMIVAFCDALLAKDLPGRQTYQVFRQKRPFLGRGNYSVELVVVEKVAAL